MPTSHAAQRAQFICQSKSQPGPYLDLDLRWQSCLVSAQVIKWQRCLGVARHSCMRSLSPGIRNLVVTLYNSCMFIGYLLAALLFICSHPHLWRASHHRLASSNHLSVPPQANSACAYQTPRPRTPSPFPPPQKTSEEPAQSPACSFQPGRAGNQIMPARNVMTSALSCGLTMRSCAIRLVAYACCIWRERGTGRKVGPNGNNLTIDQVLCQSYRVIVG